MGSSRFTGKVVADLAGRPLLTFMLERLAPLGLEVVVATSEFDRDDVVAQVAGDAGARVVRGPEADVLGRFALALHLYPAPTVVRLTADCPLIDPALVRAALELQDATAADYASNTVVRTFPDGLDVEVVRSEALLAAAAEATDPYEREHVTPFIYRRPDRFSHVVLRHDEDLSAERWTVDTPEDLDVVRTAVARLGRRTDFGWKEVQRVLDAPRA
jgi:spore coat polysaccharide biosynthesis protein SpsF (cytidylyltransferase family)